MTSPGPTLRTRCHRCPLASTMHSKQAARGLTSPTREQQENP